MAAMHKEWFEEWFESPWYQKLYASRTKQEADMAISLLEKSAALQNNAQVLDLCCGTGRHAFSLGERGYRVMGLDYSKYFISKAKSENSLDNVQFVVGDMRNPLPGGPYDCIANFFTSFGYFDQDIDNFSVFTQVWNALKNNGYFFFDFLNADWIMQTIQPETITTIEDTTLIQTRSIDWHILPGHEKREPHAVRKNIVIMQHGQILGTYNEYVRMYKPAILRSAMQSNGFDIVHEFGDYDGRAYSPDSRRWIAVARKVV
jgi:SAM-dependent methyltransferase